MKASGPSANYDHHDSQRRSPRTTQPIPQGRQSGGATTGLWLACPCLVPLPTKVSGLMDRHGRAVLEVGNKSKGGVSNFLLTSRDHVEQKDNGKSISCL